MSIAMAPANAENFFGKQPPDLSVIARRRGADWLYTYFKSFYIDESRPFGVNNAVFKDVGMPDVFWNWEGMKKPVYETVTVNGEKEQVIKDFEYVKKGSMTPAEFDKTMHDLTNFMVYMGEPIRMERQRIGIWVLAFLAVFFVFAYLLKREYWKDVH
jgi:ubiquinol-cytochrome c reductase cytochrome c1 subunit